MPIHARQQTGSAPPDLRRCRSWMPAYIAVSEAVTHGTGRLAPFR